MPPSLRPTRCGFTLTEILIVVALIILLLSIVVVALNKATQRAQAVNTSFLMNSIAKGLIRFKDDIGYYPPVLRRNPDQPTTTPRDLALPYDPTDLSPGGIDKLNQWYSITSLAEYLVGYGNHEEDGWGTVSGTTTDWENETPRVGIRHPGSDGVWGATFSTHKDGDGGLLSRMYGGGGARGSANDPLPIDQGKTYGPYIELSSDRVLAAIDSDGKVVFPNEAGYQDDLPKIIVDYWGEPIRYYRLPYPLGSLKQSLRAGMDIPRASGGTRPLLATPSLGNVIALRPYLIAEGAATDVAEEYQDRADQHGFTDRDSTTSRSLKSGEFALLSSGPDRAYGGLKFPDDPLLSYPEVRADQEGLNEDNILEVGP